MCSNSNTWVKRADHKQCSIIVILTCLTLPMSSSLQLGSTGTQMFPAMDLDVINMVLEINGESLLVVLLLVLWGPLPHLPMAADDGPSSCPQRMSLQVATEMLLSRLCLR